ncbi:MAG: hypothetical protein R3D55_26245 [Chloroflexota bacterium]
MRKFLFLTLVLICTMILAVALHAAETGSSASPQTARLSDQSQTEGGLGTLPNLHGVAAGSQAYAAWIERVSTSPDTYQLFLRELPDGPIQTLPYSQLVATPGFPNSYISLTSIGDENGRVCLTWRESVANEGGNLMLWCTGDAQKRMLSDNTLSQGNIIGQVEMMFDSTGNLHVVWVEEGPGFSQQELFHWEESGQTTQVLSDFSTHSFVPSFAVLMHGNNLYVAWSEYSPAFLFTPYLWDSHSDTVKDLSLPNEMYATNLSLFEDSQGTVHAIWLGDLAPTEPDACPFHWDTASQQTRTVGSANNGCLIPFGFFWHGEAAGKLHLVYLGAGSSGLQDTLYHWAPGGVQTAVSQGLSNSLSGIQLATDSSGTAHLVFPAVVTPFFYNDMFYWNSNTQTRTYISDTLLFTRAVNTNEVTSRLDSNGVFHVVWAETVEDTLEDDLFYWRSDSGATVRVSDTAVTTGNAQNPILNEDSSGNMQIVWQENAPGSGQAALFHWDTANTTTSLLTEMGTNPILRHQWFDPANTYHAAWTRNAGSDNDLFYFDSANGVINVSTQAATNGEIVDDFETIQLLPSAANWYLLWAEDTGTAEGEDLFTAYDANLENPPEASTSIIYLPLVQK